jgi:ketosteroid isomerase-like protein
MAKQRAWRLIALTVSCTGLLACSTGPTDSTAEAAATIRQDEASWIKDLGTRQIDATISYYGDGALLLAPNAPIARTKEQIRQTWMQIFAAVPVGATFSGETTKVEVSRSGDLAYAIGTYAFANPPIDKGKFFDVWKKQADGSWKAVVSTFNSDLPVTPPAR